MRPRHWLYTIPLRLRSLFRSRRVDQELNEELQFHLERKIEEGIAGGLSPDEARYAALRAMDGLEQRKEEMRTMRQVRWLTDFVADVHYAIRSLRRTPGLTAFVVITIALGIGMTTTPFSMLDALIFRPYPVPRPGNVVTLVSTSRDNAFGGFSYREYLDIRAHTKSYDGVVAGTTLASVGFSADPGAAPRVRAGMLVSGNYFRVLGVEPQVGRGFRDEEDTVPGRDAVMVLGPGFWKHEFGGDPSVVGRVVRLNGTDFTVVGVAPDISRPAHRERLRVEQLQRFAGRERRIERGHERRRSVCVWIGDVRGKPILYPSVLRWAPATVLQPRGRRHVSSRIGAGLQLSERRVSRRGVLLHATPV